MSSFIPIIQQQQTQLIKQLRQQENMRWIQSIVCIDRQRANTTKTDINNRYYRLTVLYKIGDHANTHSQIHDNVLILQQTSINSQAPNIIIAHLRSTVLNVATFQNFAIELLYNQYMNSQSQSSDKAPKQPKLNRESSSQDRLIKRSSKKASSLDSKSVKLNEFNRRPKIFSCRQEMENSLKQSIKYLNGSLYEDLWASAIASSMKLFGTNIKTGQQFHLNADNINQILLSLKYQMEASLQDEEIQKKKKNMEFLNKDNIMLQLEKSGYKGQIDLSIQDPQQYALHKEICNSVQKMKENGQEAWYIENFCGTETFLQNEKCLFVFQLKRNVQLLPSKIPKYLTQIIKIVLATQELYFEKLIQCKVLRQFYYRKLFRTKESADKILEKPKIMLYYIINNNITRDQFIQTFSQVKPIVGHLFSQLEVVLNVIGYNPISPNQLKKLNQLQKQREAQMKQFQQKLRAEMKRQREIQMERQKEREAQREEKLRAEMKQREAQMKAQMQNLKEQLALLMKEKSS